MSIPKLATLKGANNTAAARVKSPPSVRQGASTPPQERATKRRRTTETIELLSAHDVQAGLLHALHIGLPMNRHLTLNWAAMGIEDPVEATGRFLKLVKDAARRRGAQVAHVWVREVGPVVGEHVHVLLHVPDFPGWLQRRKSNWLKQCGAIAASGSSRTRTIRGCRQDSHGQLQSPGLYGANLKTLEAYVLKHCSSDVSEAFGFKSAGGCSLSGKRVSISQNLHRKARSRCEHCALLSCVPAAH